MSSCTMPSVSRIQLFNTFRPNEHSNSINIISIASWNSNLVEHNILENTLKLQVGGARSNLKVGGAQNGRF